MALRRQQHSRPGGWSEPSNSEPSVSAWAAVSATRDASGNPVAFAISAPTDGTNTQSLYEYAGFQWSVTSTGQFTAISATRDGSNNPAVFGVLNTPGTYDYTVWKWVSGAWTELSTTGFNQFTSLSATQDGGANAPVLYAVAYGTQTPQNPTAQTLDYNNGAVDRSVRGGKHHGERHAQRLGGRSAFRRPNRLADRRRRPRPRRMGARVVAILDLGSSLHASAVMNRYGIGREKQRGLPTGRK